MKLLCFLRFYPITWRRRYEPEFAAMLEQSPASASVIFDVLRGAIDAHLHFHFLNTDDSRRIRMNSSNLFNEATAAEVSAFTKSFAQSVEQGQSLVRSLLALGNQQSDPPFRQAIELVNQEVQKGQTLSGALSHHPKFFNDHYVKAVQLGEVSEKLDVMLRRLAAGEEMDVEAETEIVLQRLATAAYQVRKQGD